MPKRPGSESNQDKKIIPFPKLKDRLVERGLEKLQDQQHEEAISLLMEAFEMDKDDPVTTTSLAVALYEDHRWQEAKELCEKMLREGLGDYEETLELYIMNLFQLKDHDKIASTIQTVMDEGILTPERAERFNHLLSISRKQDQQEEQRETSLDDLVLHKDLEQQMVQAANLSKQNIHPIKMSIIELIKVKETHPFIKTMLLNVLREQGVKDEVEVEKWGQKSTVSPSQLQDPFESEFFQSVVAQIQQQAGHEDPNLVELAVDIIKRHQFLLYPYSWIEQDQEIISRAYLHLAERYMGVEMEWDEEEMEGVADEIETLEMVPIV
ncbi:tetratricopeptide repeat protein [Jeotgalibacillus proteolyticus]|uniref:Tetratricopeptide repeat protein n=1 Tax=Jeotgalibacillus proteolyticus TaxID=2082395 RepID=A0A2S5GEZ2_9BACL|nr:tetratricopeptide repeat protein [Jeotgalibacillus proteolyticus]PPA71566.1 hypothetical protein C4B60_05760 [Jeotgalibacillus proteolyticus]